MTEPADPTVLVRRHGRIGRLTLNRARALNALDLGMIRTIAAALGEWRDDPAVHAVVLDAAGDRAFCAGGDIRHLRQLAIDGAFDEIERFFAEEYALNLMTARYPKPYVSLIDGICMGGGIGLAVHGSVRVTTEAAKFAMPETAIGLFPDVGATFILPRLRGDSGLWMGLTGARVGGPEAVWLGLATHFVPHAALAGLADALAHDGMSALAAVTEPPPRAVLPDIAPFGSGSVGAIMQALHAAGTPWAHETLATMRQASPSAVLCTFDILQAGARRTLEQCQAAELALMMRMIRHPDFLEGVRAMVVDKDRAPRWAPASLEDG